MPPDGDIFKLREKEKQQKLEVKFNLIISYTFSMPKVQYLFQERERNKTLKVHQKLTTNTKLVEGMKAGLKPDLSDDEVDGENEVYKSNDFYLFNN